MTERNANAGGAKAKAKRKLIAVLAVIAVVVVAIIGVFAYQKSQDKGRDVVTVGIVGSTDNAIWAAVQSELDKRGSNVKVEVKSFQDGQYANQAVDNGDLDLTAFQHQAFLDSEIKQHGYKVAVLANTVIQPLNVYSDKVKSVDELKDGDTIAIPNNATNAGRALKVLQSAGVIKVDPAKGYTPSTDDITDNPRHLKFDQVDPTQIMNLLPDYAAGITNTGSVLDSGHSPDEAIYKVPEDLNSEYNKPYINVITSREDRKDTPAFKEIIDAYHTKAVADAIQTAYKGAAKPAFTY